MQVTTVICPHRLTDLCDDPELYQRCGHGYCHEPVKAHGFTCCNAEGGCGYTDLLVRCVHLSVRRVQQLKPILRPEEIMSKRDQCEECCHHNVCRGVVKDEEVCKEREEGEPYA